MKFTHCLKKSLINKNALSIPELLAGLIVSAVVLGLTTQIIVNTSSHISRIQDYSEIIHESSYIFKNIGDRVDRTTFTSNGALVDSDFIGIKLINQLSNLNPDFEDGTEVFTAGSSIVKSEAEKPVPFTSVSGTNCLKLTKFKDKYKANATIPTLNTVDSFYLRFYMFIPEKLNATFIVRVGDENGFIKEISLNDSRIKKQAWNQINFRIPRISAGNKLSFEINTENLDENVEPLVYIDNLLLLNLTENFRGYSKPTDLYLEGLDWFKDEYIVSTSDWQGNYLELQLVNNENEPINLLFNNNKVILTFNDKKYVLPLGEFSELTKKRKIVQLKNITVDIYPIKKNEIIGGEIVGDKVIGGLYSGNYLFTLTLTLKNGEVEETFRTSYTLKGNGGNTIDIHYTSTLDTDNSDLVIPNEDASNSDPLEPNPII